MVACTAGKGPWSDSGAAVTGNSGGVQRGSRLKLLLSLCFILSVKCEGRERRKRKDCLLLDVGIILCGNSQSCSQACCRRRWKTAERVLASGNCWGLEDITAKEA